MRRKLPVLILALIILLQAFVPAVYASSENKAISSSVYLCPFDSTSKGAGEATGQLHHILSNKTMKALNEHPTLKGVFEREDAAFKYRAKDTNAHKGYQQWHRDVDNETVKWLRDHPTATPEQFKKFVNDLFVVR